MIGKSLRDERLRTAAVPAPGTAELDRVGPARASISDRFGSLAAYASVSTMVEVQD